MDFEREGTAKIEHQPSDSVHKIHKTHFHVLKTQLHDNNFDSGYEWKDLGNGHFKLVPKKTEDTPEKK